MLRQNSSVSLNPESPPQPSISSNFQCNSLPQNPFLDEFLRQEEEISDISQSHNPFSLEFSDWRKKISDTSQSSCDSGFASCADNMTSSYLAAINSRSELNTSHSDTSDESMSSYKENYLYGERKHRSVGSESESSESQLEDNQFPEIVQESTEDSVKHEWQADLLPVRGICKSPNSPKTVIDKASRIQCPHCKTSRNVVSFNKNATVQQRSCSACVSLGKEFITAAAELSTLTNISPNHLEGLHSDARSRGGKIQTIESSQDRVHHVSHGVKRPGKVVRQVESPNSGYSSAEDMSDQNSSLNMRRLSSSLGDLDEVRSNENLGSLIDSNSSSLVMSDEMMMPYNEDLHHMNAPTTINQVRTSRKTSLESHSSRKNSLESQASKKNSLESTSGKYKKRLPPLLVGYKDTYRKPSARKKLDRSASTCVE